MVGFSMLWFVLLSCWSKNIIQAELARFAIATGEPFLHAFDRLPGKFPAFNGKRVSWHIYFWLIWIIPGIFGGEGIRALYRAGRQIRRMGRTSERMDQGHAARRDYDSPAADQRNHTILHVGCGNSPPHRRTFAVVVPLISSICYFIFRNPVGMLSIAHMIGAIQYPIFAGGAFYLRYKHLFTNCSI